MKISTTSAVSLRTSRTLRNGRKHGLRSGILAASIATLAGLGGVSVHAQTWQGTTNDFNTGTNWTGGAVPTTTAVFANTGLTSLTFSSGSTTIGTLQFNAGAPAYSFSTGANSLTLNGSGIVDNSSNPPTLTAGSGGTITFASSASAGDAILNATGGTLNFNGNSAGSTAQITASGGGTVSIATGASVGATTFTNNSTSATAVGITGAGSLSANSVVNTAGTFTNNGTVTATGGVTISGGTLGGTGSIAGSLNYSSSSNSNYGGSITGAGNTVTLNSSGGVLTLSGQSSYTGATNIQNGTIQAGFNNALPTGTAVTLNNAAGSGTATLALNGFNQTIASLSFVAPSTSGTTGSNVTLGGGTLMVNGSISVVSNTTNPGSGFTSSISGSGALDLGGAVQTFNVASQGYGLPGGTGNSDLVVSSTIQNGGVTIVGTNSTTQGTFAIVTFSGNNTYAQGTTINSGALIAAGSAALGTGPVTVNSGGSLVVAAGVTTGAGQTLTLNGSGATPTGGTGIGALATDGSGGTATYAGPITVAGNATIQTNNNSGGAPGDTLTLSGPIAISSATPNVALTLQGSGVSGAAGTINVTGVIGGGTAGSNTAFPTLVVNGVTANLSATSANTYAGPTIITSINAGDGVLNANSGGALPTANGRTSITMDATGAGGSALNIVASQSIASLAGANSSLVSVSTGQVLTVGFGNAPDTNGTANANFAGVISGAGGLTKDETSMQILSGANTYTGGTTITGGTVVVNNSIPGTSSSIGTGALTFNGGTLQMQTGAGALTFTNATAINSTGGTFDASGQSLTWTGNITDGTGGPGTLKVIDSTGGGTVIFNPATAGGNTYTSATVVGDGTNSVTLQGGAANAFSAASATTVNASATLDLGGFAQTVSSLAGAGTVTNSGTADAILTNQGASSVFSGVIQDGGTNKTGLTQNSPGNTLTLTRANTYSGQTTINGGTLLLTGVGSVSNSSRVNVANAAATFDISGTTAGTSIISLAGVANSKVNLGAQTLTLTNAADTFGGVIQGTGGLMLTAGNETLSGVNTYSGQTTINGGTVFLTGVGSVSNSSRVNLANAAGTFNISGTTAGASIVSLAGVANSSVVLGAGKTLTLTSAADTFLGVISGTGTSGLTLTKGSETLSGVNTYAGPTKVNGGILSLANAAGRTLTNTGAVTVNATGTLNLVTSQTIASLAGNGTVTLNTQTLTTGLDNSSTTFSGVISGAGGALVKNGAGTFIESGANSYTGGTTLNAGALAVGNTKGLGSGNLTVNGGTFQTSGGPLIVNIGGGNVSFNNGTYVANVGGATAGTTYDQLLTTGSVKAFNGNLVLVQQNSYLLAPGDKINLVVAAGGVAHGTALGFAVPNAFITGLAAFSNNPLLIPTVNVYPTTVTLEAMQGSFLGLGNTLGFTPNQIATAAALDSVANTIGKKTGIYQELNFLDTQPLSTLPGNLDKIAPAELTSIFSGSVALANIQTANLERRMEDIRSQATSPYEPGTAGSGNNTVYADGAHGPVGHRSKEIAPPSEERWGMFLVGSGEFTRVGSTSNASGYDLQTGGVTAGIDYRVNNHFAVGLDLGYVGTTASLANSGRLTTDGGRLGIFATYFAEGFHLDTAVNAGLNSYNTRRTTPNNTAATASPNGSEINVLVATGYDWKVGGLTVGPTASYQYTNVAVGGFTETALFAPLTVHGQSAESSRTALGARAYYDAHAGGFIIRPEVKLAWQHEFGTTAYSLTSNFATLGGNAFTVSGPAIGRDSLLASAGVSFLFNDRFAFYVYYDGEIARTNYSSNNVSGGFRLQF
jgi:fibronectin-binding autotransporter adhesin